jgi:hypothetical protein
LEEDARLEGACDLAAVTSLVYELPFGHSRRFLSGSNAVTNTVLGGRQISAINTMQAGTPFNMGYTPNSANAVSPQPTAMSTAPTSSATKNDSYSSGQQLWMIGRTRSDSDHRTFCPNDDGKGSGGSILHSEVSISLETKYQQIYLSLPNVPQDLLVWLSHTHKCMRLAELIRVTGNDGLDSTIEMLLNAMKLLGTVYISGINDV